MITKQDHIETLLAHSYMIMAWITHDYIALSESQQTIRITPNMCSSQDQSESQFIKLQEDAMAVYGQRVSMMGTVDDYPRSYRSTQGQAGNRSCMKKQLCGAIRPWEERQVGGGGCFGGCMHPLVHIMGPGTRLLVIGYHTVSL